MEMEIDPNSHLSLETIYCKAHIAVIKNCFKWGFRNISWYMIHVHKPTELPVLVENTDFLDVEIEKPLTSRYS